jgi:hypothetical protein
LSYGRSPELTFLRTSGVGYKNVSSKDVSNKDVSSINVSSLKNYNKRSSFLFVFLI